MLCSLEVLRTEAAAAFWRFDASSVVTAVWMMEMEAGGNRSQPLAKERVDWR